MTGRKAKNVQVHKCLFCSKEFKRVGNLQNHLKKVHEVTDIETQESEVSKFENTENDVLLKSQKEHD